MKRHRQPRYLGCYHPASVSLAWLRLGRQSPRCSLTALKGEQNGNDVQEWFFNYTAFMKQGGATSLKLEFYNEAGQYVADQTLTDVDPRMTVLEGDITINEDDGLAKGKKYTLKLTGTLKGKEVIFAKSGPVLMD